MDLDEDSGGESGREAVILVKEERVEALLPGRLSSRYGNRKLDLDVSILFSHLFICCERRSSGFERSGSSRVLLSFGI